MSQLNYIEKQLGENPTSTIIWLHGLGASGDDFVPAIPALNLNEKYSVRFIFPHAPMLPVTINGGMVMPAWYDIKKMSINRDVDTEQLRHSAKMIGELIEKEIQRGIDSRKIFIFGFSQGGAVGYESILSYNKPLGGLVALSTYFATMDTIHFSQENANVPIFIAHGSYDNVVPEELGQKAHDTLKEKNYHHLVYKKYPIDHSVCLPELQDIGLWINNILDSY